ncbi:MBL fold metallo-hydrolase [Paenibacillus kandeliae]|uniref:MBL fold metallo-hydrolase n=1 Tax=Paenibacillus kandeliae TaxID=3231269 RepID=UPI003459A8AB
MKHSNVSLWLGAAGYCTHPEILTIRGGTWRPTAFPAGFACIQHPQHGMILFDTGYSMRFFEETRRLPQALYRYLTPVVYTEQDHSGVQLEQEAGVRAEEIRYVILSHFHGDHIAAARDFPNAQFIYLQESYAAVKRLNTWNAVRAGFLAGLLPDDFEQRSLPFTRSDLQYDHERQLDERTQSEQSGNDGYAAGGLATTILSTLATPFGVAASVLPDLGVPYYDVFGDGSIRALELSGHAEGMIGLLLHAGGEPYLLCADTVWSSRAFAENRRPHPLAGLIMSNRQQFRSNMDRLRRWHLKYPQLRIVPTHCREALAMWGGRWLK